ncbi:AlgP family protein [Stutzerimonas chloritidismutans]
MPAKKQSVDTPLHLLQQLSRSLVEHLQKACGSAQREAEVLLAKLEKQRGKTQEKLVKARAKLDDAGSAGKAKAQTRARSRISELDDMLALLQSRQSETLNYLAELKRDAEQALKLAEGVTQVQQAAAKALEARKSGAPANTSKQKAPASRRATPKAATVASSDKVTATKRPATSGGSARPSTKATRPTASGANASAPVARKAAAKPAARPATKPAGKPASARSKPASAEPATAASSVEKAPAAQPPAGKPATARKPAAKKPRSSKPSAKASPNTQTSAG